MSDGVRLAVALLVPLSIGILSGWVTAAGVRDWYPRLRKPWFTPPSWVFGPVWTVLYLMMGYALYRVWSIDANGGGVGTLPWVLFAVQLALNAAWSPVFFLLRRPGAAIPVVLALWAAVLATVVVFWRLDTVAGLLLLPYLVWVTLASALNVRIHQLNP